MRADSIHILPKPDLITQSTAPTHLDAKNNATIVRPQQRNYLPQPKKHTPDVDLTPTSETTAAVNWEETNDTDHWEALYLNGISVERKRYTAGNSQEFAIVLSIIES
jgi:hypothetical protein